MSATTKRIRPTCRRDDCDREAKSAGSLCSAHQWRLNRGLPLDTPIARRARKDLAQRCAVDACSRTAVCWHGEDRICGSHMSRIKRGMEDWRERPMPPLRGRSRHTRGKAVLINVRLPVDMARRLDLLAEARNVTRGTVARMAVEAWMAATKPTGRTSSAELEDSAAWARRALEWEAA